jgi:hypothetical protein
MFRRERNAPRDLAGIAIESADGSHIDGVVISNFTMQGIYSPIFIRLGNRGRGLNPPRPGSIENISISHVIATASSMTSAITGLAGAPVRHVVLDNIQLAVQGGGQLGKGLDVPEADAKYPESNMFGALPAYGLYVRHAEGLTLRNVQTRWLSSDPRSAMIFDDVKDLDIDGFAADTVAGSEPLLWFHKVIGAFRPRQPRPGYHAALPPPNRDGQGRGPPRRQRHALELHHDPLRVRLLARPHHARHDRRRNHRRAKPEPVRHPSDQISTPMPAPVPPSPLTEATARV